MTRAELIQAVKDNTARDDRNDQVIRLLNQGLTYFLQRHPWQEAHVSQNLAIVLDQQSVALPENMDRLISVRIIESTTGSTTIQGYELQILTRAREIELCPQPLTQPRGKPTICSLVGKLLHLLPYSDGDYNLILNYVQKMTMDTDDQTLPIPRLEETLIAYTTANLFRSLQQYDDALAWDRQTERSFVAARKVDEDQGQQLTMRPFDGTYRQGYQSADPQNDPFVKSWH